MIRAKIKYIASLIILLVLTAPTLMTSCGSDEPAEIEKTNHRPGGSEGGNSGSENGEDNGDEDENENKNEEEEGTENGEENSEQSPIVGIWTDLSDSSILSFSDKGGYEAKSKDGAVVESGEYTYKELKHHLSISIDNGSEVFVKEYKCFIEQDSMTLYEKSGKKKELSRKK